MNDMDFIVEENRVYRYMANQWIHVGELNGRSLAVFKLYYFGLQHDRVMKRRSLERFDSEQTQEIRI